jgi:MFS family permease
MSASTRSARMIRMQWIAMALITGAIALNYMDRSTLAVGNVKIRAEFGLTATQIGAPQSAWSIMYAVFQIPIGYFLDRSGPRFLVGAALVLWSIAQGAGGLAVSYVQLLWSRIALGITECPAFPAAVRVTSDWFHVKDRGRPTGMYNAGGGIGPAIAPPLLTGIMLAFGWRAMFVTMGVVGVLGAVIWFLLYRSPATADLTPEDRAYLRDNQVSESPVTAGQWFRLFRFRTIWALILVAFCTGYAVWMYQTWLPAYLEMQQHVSIVRTGLLASVPLLCSILGSFAGGHVSDWLVAHGVDLIASRKWPAVVGLLASGLFTGIAMTAHSGGAAVTFMSAAMFFLSLGIAGKWTLITAVAPQSYATSAASIQNFGGYIGGTVSPIATGMVVDATGSFVLALAIGAIVTVMGACILVFMLRSPISVADLEPPTTAPVPAQ